MLLHLVLNKKTPWSEWKESSNKISSSLGFALPLAISINCYTFLNVMNYGELQGTRASYGSLNSLIYYKVFIKMGLIFLCLQFQTCPGLYKICPVIEIKNIILTLQCQHLPHPSLYHTFGNMYVFLVCLLKVFYSCDDSKLNI